MKRTSAVLSALLVGLTFTVAALCFGAHTQVHAARAEKGVTFQGQRPTLTIIYRGLMVFHPDPGQKYVEVGVLQAPEHQLGIEVREISRKGVSTFSIPFPQLEHADRDVWQFEFASRSTKGISFYQNGAFDRKRGLGDARDFRWVVDLEGGEFYDRELPTNTNQLGLVLHVTSGEFSTKAKTAPLVRKKGDGTFQYFGSAAEEVATEVFTEGDTVLRSQKTGVEIIRLKTKPDTTYQIVISNTVAAHHQIASSLNHFQYYYRLIAEPTPEWYEFDLSHNSISSAATNALMGARIVSANYVIPMDPEPTLCGQVLLSKRKLPLR